ncbi:hypothetical protein [Anatilimnocola floriformis]|uniref:hypothetical protein n=1 Tax=Anatilimnocola floriformis TaxID=2948575 RepID=UPI0020C3FC5A|nr:hypothetical protein [Anatilimnocola floriformis]
MATDYYNLLIINERTQADLRKLRYCIEHRLVPETIESRVVDDARGQPREFDLLTSTLLVAVVRLIEAGVKRDHVAWIMNHIRSNPGPRKSKLHTSLAADATIHGKGGKVLTGDGSHMRWIIGDYDSGWMKFKSKAVPASEFQPLIEISIDLGRICKQILGQ